MTVATLSTGQRKAFARDGFVVLPSVVSRTKTDAALQAINHWLDTGYDPRQLPNYRMWTFAPELVANPLIIGLLLDSPAFDLSAALVGRPLDCPTEAQIALRFPVAPGTQPTVPPPHIDGVTNTLHGFPSGKLRSFTMLACVLLSDVPEAGHGNLTVWPGSHVAMARWLSDRGYADRVDDPTEFLRHSAALADGVAEPVAVTGRAGDVILAHYLLMHSPGSHKGPGIRYAVFFRLSAQGRHELGDSVFTDPWAEWDAIRGDSNNP